MGKIQERMQQLGLTLPAAAKPVANYVPWVKAGNLVFISGQIAMQGGQAQHVGQLGAGIEVAQGAAAARICALNVLAQLNEACGGDLDKVAQVVKLVGFVNAAPHFTDIPKVVNGASDLMVEIFGEAGRHARSAVGVAALPLGVCVEVEAVVELR